MQGRSPGAASRGENVGPLEVAERGIRSAFELQGRELKELKEEVWDYLYALLGLWKGKEFRLGLWLIGVILLEFGSTFLGWFSFSFLLLSIGMKHNDYNISYRVEFEYLFDDGNLVLFFDLINGGI